MYSGRVPAVVSVAEEGLRSRHWVCGKFDQAWRQSGVSLTVDPLYKYIYIVPNTIIHVSW